MDSPHSQASQIFEDAAPAIYATFWERLGAWIIDILVLSLPNYLINRMMGYDMFDGFYARNGAIGYHNPNMNFVVIIVNWLYFALQESGPAGATLGKRALGIMATNESGGRISFGQATGRYFGKYVSFIILLIGFLMVIWDSKRQALHDKMAGTFIVKR